MTKLNLRDVPELEQRSPSGRFHSFARNLSLALGGQRNVGPWGGGHPFDFQLRRVPPGAAICPLHLHLCQWELFVIHRGHGTVRLDATTHEVREGDCFVHPPGEAHQLTNTGRDDLEVFIVADNPAQDAFYYPDSDKWGLRAPLVQPAAGSPGIFRAFAADYFDGEDPPPAAPSPSANVRNTNLERTGPDSGNARLAPELSPPATPFARRRVNLADVPWETFASPAGKFRSSGQQISLALGAVGRAPLTQGGHPFDLELSLLPPGATACPFHWHALQWEFYYFLEGRGEFRLGDARFEVGPGDAVMAPPFAPHTYRNTGETDLRCFIVADDPPADYRYYPDSGKYGFSHPRKIFRLAETDYFDGED